MWSEKPQKPFGGGCELSSPKAADRGNRGKSTWGCQRDVRAGSGTGRAQGGCTHLHAVGEHDTHRNQLGEDLEQLWVGEHAVLQAVVQEAGVVAQDIINVGCL